MYALKYEDKWVSYHELPGLFISNSYSKREENKLDDPEGFEHWYTPTFQSIEQAQAVMETKEFKYLMGEPYIKQPCTVKDFQIVEV